MRIVLQIVVLCILLHFVYSESVLSLQLENENEYFFGETAKNDIELTHLVIFILGSYNYTGEESCEKQFEQWMNGSFIYFF